MKNKNCASHLVGPPITLDYPPSSPPSPLCIKLRQKSHNRLEFGYLIIDSPGLVLVGHGRDHG